MRLCIALLFAACTLAAQSDVPRLKSVDSVDLDRYIGRWYEVARLPNRFQDDCASDTTATYAMQLDGRLSVVNECRKADGSLMSAEGAARKVGDAKLKVRFAPAWLSFLPMVWGDYWVIDLAEDYSWAVVGEPGLKYFWILSREPQVEESLIEGIVKRAEAQGYDLSAMIRTRQEAQPHSRLPQR
jgi:apolipoprotein D and lipocalin family protein